jgi:LTXXQ motif family protein
MAEMSKNFEKSLETILDPDQQDRLIGLMLQRSGVRAATSSEMVAASLEITDEQKTKFTEAEKLNGEEMAKAMEGMGGRGPRGGGDAGGQEQTDEERTAQREKFMKKMEEMNKAAEERLLAVLTAEQKSKMESLKGEKFSFPEQQFGGFGGGGPGGGGRPGRGNRPGGGGN